MMLVEKERKIPVLASVDVCVLGGGTTGVMAAIRAARMGASVLIVEQQGNFGGNGTSGMVCAWHTLLDFDFDQKIISGLSEEFLKRLDKRHALRVVPHDRPSYKSRMERISTYIFNPQELKIECDEMLKEAGVVCCLHTMFCAPWAVGGDLQAVGVLADFLIDGRGAGDLAYGLDIPFRERAGKQPSTSGAVLTGYEEIENPRQVLLEHLEEYGLPILGWDTTYVNSPKVSHLLKSNVFESPLTMEGLTRGEIEGRRQVRAMQEILNKYGNTGEDVVLLGLSSSLGIREGRSMRGLYTLKFPDAIANCSYPIDIHHADKPGCTFWYLNGMSEYERDGYPHEISWWKEKSDDYPRYYQIPYRSIVPREYKNLLVCGRAMDADVRAFGAIRVMINLNQTGEAAGVAAALCVSGKTENDGLDTDLLREKLAEGGSIVL